jgi:hypothetical protein
MQFQNKAEAKKPAGGPLFGGRGLGRILPFGRK